MDQKRSFEEVQTIQWVRDGQTMDQKPSFEDVQTIQWVRNEQTMDQKPSFEDVQTINGYDTDKQWIRSRHSKTYRQYNG
jgi:hypothetical protein